MPDTHLAGLPACMSAYGYDGFYAGTQSTSPGVKHGRNWSAVKKPKADKANQKLIKKITKLIKKRAPYYGLLSSEDLNFVLPKYIDKTECTKTK